MFTLAVGVVLVWGSFAHSQGYSSPPGGHRQGSVDAGATPAELEDIGIIDKSGASVPRDIVLTGSDGRTFQVGEYMDGERPLLLVLAYYGCPMLCSMVLNGTLDGIKGIEKLPGDDYRILIVSFDPRDTSDVAKEKRAAYVEAFKRPISKIDDSDLQGFEFATGTEAEVLRLSDAVGFRYRWDDTQDQYAHAAGIFVITPNATLSTTLTGVQFAPRDIDTALSDAQKGVWRSPLKSVLMFCFQYNPQTGGYVLMAGRAMRVGAAITIVGLLFFIWRMRRAEHRKATPSHANSPAPVGEGPMTQGQS